MYKREWISELDDEQKIVQRVQHQFYQDAQWRDRCMGGRNAYREMARLYENTSGKNPIDPDLPDLTRIRESVEDLVSVAMTNDPKAHLRQNEPIDLDLKPEVRQFLLDQYIEAERNINSYVNTIFAQNQYNDIRSDCLRQSGIFGMGCVHWYLDENVSSAKNFKVRRLVGKPVPEWTDEDWKVYNRAKDSICAKHIDTRDVFWQQGIRSAFSDEMSRVHILAKKSRKEMQALHPDKTIRSCRPPYYVRVQPEASDQAETVGVLTTYQFETVDVIKEVGPEDNPTQRVAIRVERMVKTVIAGGELLERKIWSPEEEYEDGPLRLPVVPYYLFESIDHPYGFPLTKALKAVQEFLNRLHLLIFQQGMKSVSPQSLGIIANKLAADDDPTEIVRKLREGLPILFNSPDVQNINEIVQPIQNLASSVNPALLQMTRMAEDHFQKVSMAPNREAIARAESGTAKRTEIAAADRAKTPMIESTSKSEERSKDVCFEFLRSYRSEPHEASVRREAGNRETVGFNQDAVGFLPVDDPMTGLPVQNEAYESEVNPEGFAFDPVEYKENSLDIEMVAEAEGRGDLPLTFEGRMVTVASMLQNGLIALETGREIALPEAIKARDDQNRQREAEQQMEAMMMQEMDGAMGQEMTAGMPEDAATQELAQEGTGQTMADAMHDTPEAANNMSAEMQQTV